jgi:hypothetical protein
LDIPLGQFALLLIHRQSENAFELSALRKVFHELVGLRHYGLRLVNLLINWLNYDYGSGGLDHWLDYLLLLLLVDYIFGILEGIQPLFALELVHPFQLWIFIQFFLGEGPGLLQGISHEL